MFINTKITFKKLLSLITFLLFPIFFLSASPAFSDEQIRTFWEKCGLFHCSEDIETSPKRSAYHEAGHALTATLIGYEIKEATIIPKNQTGGHVTFIFVQQTYHNPNNNSFKNNSYNNLLKVLLAGYCTETIIFQKSSYGVKTDLDLAVKNALQFSNNPKQELQKALTESSNMILNNLPKLEKIAHALLNKKKLTGHEVKQIMNS